MSVKITGVYQGKKTITLNHLPSGSSIQTDAPKDNNGEGKTFSPTDLVAGALGACMMTIIAIMAERDSIDLSGMHMEVEKHMQQSPRRISALPITIHLPQRLGSDQRLKFERAAVTCPVHQSLHPDVKIDLKFLYDV